MEVVILILVLLFASFIAMGLYAGVKAIGAAKRGVDRTLSQARRSVEDTTLRARSLGQLGAPGELAQLRLRLRTAMRATRETLQAGAAEDASVAESVSLFQRLTVHARELDGELKQLERDPDRARVTERLPELREQTERIARSADSLRWAARDRARKFAEDDLASLSAQIDVEAGALRHWSVAEHPATDERDELPAAGEQPGRWPPADKGQRKASDQRHGRNDTGWPEPVERTAADGTAADGTIADGTADDRAVEWPEPPKAGEGLPVERRNSWRRTVGPWQKPGPTRPGTTD